MRQRRLGRTGLLVSEIGLGTVELGLDYGIPVDGENRRPEEHTAAHLLNRALDMGITFVDTARAYGVAEDVIGRAISSRRREIVLATKLAAIDDERLDDAELRTRVMDSVGASLKALQTDALDLLQLHHAPVAVLRRGRMAAALQEVQQAGYARFIGASTYGEEAPLAALEDGRFDTIQVAYNLVDRRLEERVLPLAVQKDVGVVVRSVLLRGTLTHRYTAIPPELDELRMAIGQLAELAEDMPGGLPELAYRYVLANPAVSVALVGTSRLSELSAAAGYAESDPLSGELLVGIRRVVVADTQQLNPGTWPAALGS